MLFGYSMMVGANRQISYERATREAARQYERCYERGVRRRLVRRLLGSSSSPITVELDRIERHPEQTVGIDEVRAVAIDEIRGCETPSGEFDDRFCPVRTHNRDAWITTAARFLRGEALPTATLVRIGEELYVRSGQAAISVARAFGQTAIDARIVGSTPGPFGKTRRYCPPDQSLERRDRARRVLSVQ